MDSQRKQSRKSSNRENFRKTSRSRKVTKEEFDKIQQELYNKTTNVWKEFILNDKCTFSY